MNFGIQYAAEGKLWQHSAPGGWHFVSLPTEISTEIRELLQSKEEGWGRLKVTVRIGDSTWKTAIWYDTKHKAYLLPVKSAIRAAESLTSDTIVHVVLWV